MLTAQPWVTYDFGMPSAGVLRSHNVSRQAVGNAVGVRGPRFVEEVMEGKTIVCEASVNVTAIVHANNQCKKMRRKSSNEREDS